MKMLKKTTRNENGKNVTILICEQPFLFFWKKIRKFRAGEEYPKGYWHWLEMPNMTLVPTRLSFQLDAWNKLPSDG